MLRNHAHKMSPQTKPRPLPKTFSTLNVKKDDTFPVFFLLN